jgi:hypothetical protein
MADANTQKTAAQQTSARRTADAYGQGWAAGHRLALHWLDDPQRGNPAMGGTLSKHVLELAGNLARASSSAERDSARGEIVGFCYALECPSHALACQDAASVRDGKGGAR